MSNEVKPHLETTLDDYKAYAYHIREDAKSRGVENTRLSIYGIYMAVIEKQAAELEQVKGEWEAMREALESIRVDVINAQGEWACVSALRIPDEMLKFREIETCVDNVFAAALDAK